jgi:arylsulfatase A-like enzyme
MTYARTIAGSERVLYDISFAAQFGLFSGIGDTLLVFLLNASGYGDPINQPAPNEMLWATPLCTLIVFVALALPLRVLIPAFRQRKLFLRMQCTFLTAYSWVLILSGGHIAQIGTVVLAVGLTSAFLRIIPLTAARQLRRRGGVVAAVFVSVGFIVWAATSLATEPFKAMKVAAVKSASRNVLVITVDTLRSDHLSGYGYNRPTSPNIDLIAREGVLFQGAFAVASWTMPSHESMLTGLYPHEHQAQERQVKNGWLTIGEALMSHGYRTGAFSANMQVFSRPVGFGEGFVHFEDYPLTFRNVAFFTPSTRRIFGHLATLFAHGDAYQFLTRKRAPDVNRALLNWIDQDSRRPFFAFLNYLDVHDPNMLPDEYRDVPWVQGFSHEADRRQSKAMQTRIDRYDRAIRYVDEHIGTLLSGLKDRGVLENTIIVITSDHGEPFGEHETVFHGTTVFREEIQVPLILFGPGLPRSQRISEPITTAALPETLLDLGGMHAGKAEPFPTPSLARYWHTADQGNEVLGEAFAELKECRQEPTKGPITSCRYGWTRTVITPEWQYLEFESARPQLYRWLTDPSESANLVDSPIGQTISKNLSIKLHNHATRHAEHSRNAKVVG